MIDGHEKAIKKLEKAAKDVTKIRPSGEHFNGGLGAGFGH